MLDVPINPVELVHEAMLAIIYIILFGEQPGNNGDDITQMRHLTLQLTKAMAISKSGVFLDQFPWLRFFGNESYSAIQEAKIANSKLLNSCQRRYESSNNKLDGIVYDMIAITKTGDSPFNFNSKHVE